MSIGQQDNRAMKRTSLTILLMIVSAASSGGQGNDRCYIKIASPLMDSSVEQGEPVKGTASIPESTELRLFRKRHGAQPWKPMPGRIVCRGRPCDWTKQVDYQVSDTRRVDIAVVAISRGQEPDAEGTVRLPVARSGCSAEVTVTVQK